ncbi:MAG TPA: hypothetical protein VK463_06215 [Desulfomonilaceae bacterium]|nr:hypothetical protein [Desulfomonilaceae bacterium]
MRTVLIRIRFFTGNSIPGTGWGHSFAADDAEPSHHFAQESPQPGNLKNLVANAYKGDRQTGIRSGVNGTPFFFINGPRYDGHPDYGSLLAALESELASLSA